MLFGSNKNKTPDASPAQAQNAGATIFDVGTQDFEDRVVRASMEKPVIVDFWAPWCGPCKQLMPVLEAAVQGAGGEVLLAKVNLDENQQLAAALRVQSVPTVFAFYQGQPVDAFQGNQPPAQIQAFIDKLKQIARNNQPDALDIPESLKEAAQALAGGDLAVAQAIYTDILKQDEKNAEAYAGFVRVLIAAGAMEQAEALVKNAPEEIAKDPAFAQAKTALDLAQNKPVENLTALEEAAAKNPDDHQAQLDLAEGQFASGMREQAIDTLIASIAKDREWNEQAARKMLLKFFEALGHSDPVTIQGRKKLSSILFS